MHIGGLVVFCPVEDDRQRRTGCVVGKGPGGAAIGHAIQLTAMLPDISPVTIGQHIANGITEKTEM